MLGLKNLLKKTNITKPINLNFCIKYIIGLLVLFVSTFSFSQSYNEDESYIEDYILNYENDYAHKQYLNSEEKLIKLDKERWERIRQNVIEGIADDGLEYSNEGGYVVQDEDNPYEKSGRSFRQHIRKKNTLRPKTLPKKKKISEPIERDLSGWNMPKWLGNLITFLVIALVAVLVFYLFFNSNVSKKSKKIQKDITSIIPTEIPKTELELLLEKAIAQEDYREAIRIYFIFIIRGLIKKDWIAWEKEKTNISYLNEMRDKPYFKEFESTVSVFEIVWYGERQLSREEYNLLEPRFKNLTHNLGER